MEFFTIKKIVILTGSELRHEFFRKYIALSTDIEVIHSFCEGKERSLRTLVEKKATNNSRLQHLSVREQSEKDFFELFCSTTIDNSNPLFLKKGEINLSDNIAKVIESKPDLLIAYGCSIIKEPLLKAFEGRFINVHLGLSPYYRGGGTNYWPLVNGEPEYVGATFMHIDSGIDTGEVIHQIRANCFLGDTPSQIGNRLIVDMSKVFRSLIVNFSKLEKVIQLPKPPNEKVYKASDYTDESVLTLYENFSNNLVDSYLSTKTDRCIKAPIVQNQALVEAK